MTNKLGYLADGGGLADVEAISVFITKALGRPGAARTFIPDLRAKFPELTLDEFVSVYEWLYRRMSEFHAEIKAMEEDRQRGP